MPRAITKCPQCGEPVTPYAAGCAICGADLEAARSELARRKERTTRLTGQLGLPRLGDDGLRIGIGVLLALAAPLFGLLFAGYVAWQANRDGRTDLRNLMLAIAVLAAVPMLTGFYPWGRFVAGL